jgi:hypothetical protein
MSAARNPVQRMFEIAVTTITLGAVGVVMKSRSRQTSSRSPYAGRRGL